MGGTDRTILIAYGTATALALLLTLALFTSTRNRRPVDTHRLEGQLSAAQIRAAANYVSAVAGK